jgi:hypothetical protein
MWLVMPNTHDENKQTKHNNTVHQINDSYQHYNVMCLYSVFCLWLVVILSDTLILVLYLHVYLEE